MNEIVRVKCPHREGLAYRLESDDLGCLPCLCNEPVEVLETYAILGDPAEMRGAVLTALLASDWAADAANIRAVVMRAIIPVIPPGSGGRG